MKKPENGMLRNLKAAALIVAIAGPIMGGVASLVIRQAQLEGHVEHITDNQEAARVQIMDTQRQIRQMNGTLQRLVGTVESLGEP